VSEKGISVVVAVEEVMVVLIVVIRPGAGENEFGEERLTLMPVAALTDGSIVITVTGQISSSKMAKAE
jgi:hypothetical protein